SGTFKNFHPASSLILSVAGCAEFRPVLAVLLVCLFAYILHDLSALNGIRNNQIRIYKLVGSLIRAVVTDIVEALRGNFRLEDIIHELICSVLIGRLAGDKHTHDSESKALFWQYHFQIRFLRQSGSYLRGIDEAHAGLSVKKGVLRVVILDQTHIGSKLQKLLSCLFNRVDVL